MLLNSCQPWIKQEFQSEHPRKRKIKSKHVHSSTSSPTHKQNTASHTDRHPWMNRTCMLPKKPSQVPSERFKWLQVPFPFSSVGYVWGGNAPTALYLSNKLCAIKPTCLLSILKCIFKSPFTNLRDRNKFNELRNESPEHDTKTQEYTQEQLPSPPTIMLSAYCS